MEHIRNWLLPVLLGAGYVVLPYASADALDIQVSRAEFAAGTAATVVAAVALGFRRRKPLATLCVATLVTGLGYLATDPDGLGVLPAETVALYSVAVRCRAAVTWRATAALVGVTTLTSFGVLGPGEDYAIEAGTSVFFYLLIVGLGRSRRRRKARLTAVEDRRREAAAVERRRLARELHDVSAHHLTSIVVSSSAAERLDDRQPELAGEALTFAAKTGREILTALRRLVAVLETGERDRVEPLAGRITELAVAFGRLGQQVRIDVEPELSGPSADAVFGVVRESLTNTLRYAPGAAVLVVVRRVSDRILVLVENGRGMTVPAAAHGSGRGIAGMRERAVAAGGTLTAEPGVNGGWRVRADLPADTPALTPTPLHRVAPWRERWVTDVGIALAVVALPALEVAATVTVEPPTGLAPMMSLALLLSLLPGLSLLGRRDRPLTALAGVVAAAWLWPVAIGLGALPASSATVPLTSVGTHAAAVYAVAVYGTVSGLNWWSVPASAVGFGTAVGAVEAVAPFEGMFDPGFVAALIIAITLCTALLLWGCWAAGRAVRRRKDRRLGGGSEALGEVVRAAEAAVHTERRRIATGLHHSVLDRTSRMVAKAEAGDLKGVSSEARSALTAMRELLETLHEDGHPAPRTPHQVSR